MDKPDTRQRKIVVNLVLHVNTHDSSNMVNVAERRRCAMRDWLNRHMEDVRAVVCSSFDELDDPEVTVELDD